MQTADEFAPRLEFVVATIDQGSFTKAAAVPHTSQPALSHQIANIEREAGIRVTAVIGSE